MFLLLPVPLIHSWYIFLQHLCFSVDIVHRMKFIIMLMYLYQNHTIPETRRKGILFALVTRTRIYWIIFQNNFHINADFV